MSDTIRQLEKEEQGYVMLAVLLFSTLSLLFLIGSLDLVTSGLKMIARSRAQVEEEVLVEEAFDKTLNWLRVNSQVLVSPFLDQNFYSTFDIVNPGYGTNDFGKFPIPSRIRMNNSNEVPILVSDDILATETFPITTHILTEEPFDPALSFDSTVPGNVLSRVTLIDVVPIESSKDYGDTDWGNPVPETHFQPIYRIDTYFDIDHGAHLYGYVTTKLKFDEPGFYGIDWVKISRDCDAYDSNAGPYSLITRSAQCPVTSNGTISIKTKKVVYGSALTNDAIAQNGSWKGKVCGDFQAGCPIPGMTCEGAGCSSTEIEPFDSWSILCPKDQGNVTFKKNDTLSVDSNDPKKRCWKTVRVKSGVVLTLDSTDIPYYFKYLRIDSGGKVVISPNIAGERVTIYTNQFRSNRFMGSELDNSLNTPHQLRVNYTSTKTLSIRAPNFYGFVVAPSARVRLQQSFDLFGGVMAKQFEVTGSGMLHYDQAAGHNDPLDILFQSYGVTEVYN